MIRIFKLCALVALIAAAILAGCGSKKAAEIGAATAETAAAPVTAETAASVAATASAASAASAESEPPGQALLQARCTVCHTLDRVHKRKDTRVGWGKLVGKMIKNGAVLDEAERENLLDYLAETHGK